MFARESSSMIINRCYVNGIDNENLSDYEEFWLNIFPFTKREKKCVQQNVSVRLDFSPIPKFQFSHFINFNKLLFKKLDMI